MGGLVVIHRNYREPGHKKWLSHLTMSWLSVVSVDDDGTARVNKVHQVSSKSPSLERAIKEEGSRKRTRVESIYENP